MSAPLATYRLQLHEGFTLRDAARIVPLLQRLGISHLYLSPISQATSGSEHGYDVTDPTRINAQLGGTEAMAELSTVLRSHGMGVLLDIVPNHMAASAENEWWADLLLHGADSMHARTFDTPVASGESAPLMLPVLGAPLEEVLERGELQLAERDGRRVLQYHDHWFPIPESAGTPERVTPELLASLPYALADWRTVQERTGYRRFFDITGLVGVRVEDPAVFERTHAGILRWLEHGWIDGLRIDHIDGLRDPAGYLQQLARATSRVGSNGRCYTVVEKILATDEQLPRNWAADGTTGYELMRVASSFLVHPAGYRTLESLLERVTGERRAFDELVHGCKLEVLDTLFPAELSDVARRLAVLADVPADVCTRVLRELTAALGVYRTYVSGEGVPEEDRRRVEAARAAAQQRLQPADRTALDAICSVLLLDRARIPEHDRDRALDAIARWQQLSGPAMAKGFEDTALYRWPALLAVNDVGGEPGQCLDALDLHAFFTRRAAHEPGALNATSTHDSKRSEDVRARLLVLSERADEWAAAVERCLPQMRGAGPAIAPRDELVLLQTLVGAWPLEGEPDDEFAQRIRDYMRKAAREAKQETSWLTPDDEYERRLLSLVDRVLSAQELAGVREVLRDFAGRIALHGAVNSLAQVILKCAAPGVPDTYQGTARWRFDLVDPDNRRPVDYDELAAFTTQLEPIVARPDAGAVTRLRHGWRDGRIKQYVLMAALACRRRSAAFMGEYEPLEVTGAHAAHVLAFRRRAGSDSVVVIVPRWPARLVAHDQWPAGDAWKDTAVATGPGALRNALDGARLEPSSGRIRLAESLALLPVALLEGA